jgi:hypothetical protein
MICGEAEDFEKAGLRPQDLSTGVLVDAVEKVGYGGKPATYDESHLANPERLSKPLKPARHPQPLWFRPF